MNQPFTEVLVTIRRTLVSLAPILLTVAAVVVAAPAASADQVWYQAVGRASADAPCPATSRAEESAGWSPWIPSWAQWANGGAGGFVCTRAITWAREYAGGGICVFVDTSEDDEDLSIHVLLPGSSVPAGTLVGVYFDAACTDRAVIDGTPYSVQPEFDVVWATGGPSQARALCQASFAEDLADPQPSDIPADLWACGVVPGDSP